VVLPALGWGAKLRVALAAQQAVNSAQVQLLAMKATRRCAPYDFTIWRQRPIDVELTSTIQCDGASRD
jgi:hypothetical protein